MAIRRFAVDLASCSCTAPAKGLAIVASAIFHTSFDRNSMIDHFVPKNWFSKGMLRSIWFFLNRALCVFQCNFPFFITFTSLKEPKHHPSTSSNESSWSLSLQWRSWRCCCHTFASKWRHTNWWLSGRPSTIYHDLYGFVHGNYPKCGEHFWRGMKRIGVTCEYIQSFARSFPSWWKYCSKGLERLFHVTYLRQLIYHKNNFTRKIGGSFWSTRSTPRNAPKTSGLVSQFKSLSGNISP